MEPEIQPLFARLIAANFLSEGQRELLRRLAEHYPKGVEDTTLAAELEKSTDWNKLHSDVRTAISRLRDELQNFFKYHREGKKSEKCLQLPKGKPYHLEIVKNQHDLDPVEHFWDAHFTNGAQNRIVYTEPLFFWDERQRCFIRYLDINDESSSLDVAHIRANIPAGHPAHKLEPCFHYQASGEVQAQRTIRQWFEKQGKITVSLSRESVDGDIWKHNVIVLGNARTNKYLRALQEGLQFVLQDDRIAVKSHANKRATQYIDLHASPKERTGRYVYAIVTRRPSLVDQRCATIIAANHGRALETVARCLVTPSTLEEVYQRLKLAPGTPLPARFQLLFRVQTVDFELVPGEAELIESRVEPERGKSKSTVSPH